MRARTAIAISITLASATLGQADAEQIGHTKLYGWEINAYSDDSNGQFSHCTASTAYNSGIYLVFSIARDYSWSMGLGNPQWNLGLGNTYPVLFQVDTIPAISAVAEVPHTSLIKVPLRDSAALFRLFKNGRLLRIKTGEKIFGFDLTNSSKALDAAAMCTTAKLSAESNGANPFGVSSVPATISDDKAKAEAAAVTANLLSAAKIENFEVAEAIPPGLEMFHSVWNAPGVLGGLTIGFDKTVDEASTAIVGNAARGCKGKFATAKTPDAPDGTTSLKTACDESVATYVVIPRPRGGVYVMLVMNSPEQHKGSTPDTLNTDRPASVSAQLIDASVSITSRAR